MLLRGAPECLLQLMPLVERDKMSVWHYDILPEEVALCSNEPLLVDYP